MSTNLIINLIYSVTLINFREHHRYLIIGIAFLGIFKIPLFNYMLELGCEILFPVPEHMIVGFLLLLYHNVTLFIIEIIFYPIIRSDDSDDKLFFIILSIVVFSIVGIIAMTKFKEDNLKSYSERYKINYECRP